MAQIPYLDVQKLSKRFGAQTLFNEISFSIAEGQHVGLIAKNGTGKSTLLSILTGKEGYESGAIIYRNNLRVSCLEQSPASIRKNRYLMRVSITRAIPTRC